MYSHREPHGSLFLCFQKVLVFVGGGSADIAHSCQFADVQLTVLVGGIVAEEGGGDVLSINRFCGQWDDVGIVPYEMGYSKPCFSITHFRGLFSMYCHISS